MFLDERNHTLILKIAVVGNGAQASCRQLVKLSLFDRLQERFFGAPGDGYEVEAFSRLDSWAVSLLLVPVENQAHSALIVRNADGCIALDQSACEGTRQVLQTVGASGVPVELADAGDFETTLRRLVAHSLELVRPTLENQRQPPA